MDSTNSTVFSITFPREPAEETPCIALCGMCSRRLPHAPTDHQDVPLQLPCGCVLHFACIQFWFEAQASDTNVNGVNEVFLSFAWDETREVMNLAIALILPASECETVDPRETTFGNPGHGHPE
ncbi:ring finger protein [Neofusicoccum parvum]|uniref:Ring finger protein n=1 Tax=Neofusicoccum parvum TaxID=310453 RepID=A0ACB5RRH5_9PEZI|nr:ring finger protein [Neofusicoccum parvum]